MLMLFLRIIKIFCLRAKKHCTWLELLGLSKSKQYIVATDWAIFELCNGQKQLKMTSHHPYWHQFHWMCVLSVQSHGNHDAVNVFVTRLYVSIQSVQWVRLWNPIQNANLHVIHANPYCLHLNVTFKSLWWSALLNGKSLNAIIGSDFTIKNPIQHIYHHHIHFITFRFVAVRIQFTSITQMCAINSSLECLQP